MSENETTVSQPVKEEEGKRYSKKPAKPQRRKSCPFCIEKNVYIDYKDVNRLKKFLTEKGKIVSRRQTGVCSKHQRELTTAIKRARNMSLI